MAPLHLRLWAQSHCARIIGKVVLLEHNAKEGLVLCIDSGGIACVVCEEDGSVSAPIAEGLAAAATPEPWPVLQLQRTTQGAARWLKWPVGNASVELDAAAARELANLKARPPLTDAGRRLIVAAIEAYYQQHVLEPSVAGFLSILEKQFARSDLYLFELLQNAVDEGAMHVRVQLKANPQPGLRFSHDGHGFSPLDVNGLASVGMSTKAGKRAVGFMGIGFKVTVAATRLRALLSARAFLSARECCSSWCDFLLMPRVACAPLHRPATSALRAA